MSSAIGRRVKELRSSLKLTQVQFAENIGVKGGVVSAWEKGSAPLPYGRLLVICDAYHVSESWLKKGEGDMFAVSSPERTRSNRENAIDYIAAILRELPDETRRETADFIREILRRCDLESAVAASKTDETGKKNLKAASKKTEVKEEEEDERVQIVSADEDFGDDEYEFEYEDEEVEDEEDDFDDDEVDEEDEEEEYDFSADADFDDEDDDEEFVYEDDEDDDPDFEDEEEDVKDENEEAEVEDDEEEWDFEGNYDN